MGEIKKNSSKGKKDKAKSMQEVCYLRMLITTLKGTNQRTF